MQQCKICGRFEKNKERMAKHMKAKHPTPEAPEAPASSKKKTESKEVEKKIVTDINLKSEFDKMTDEITKKEDKKESTGNEYECGECHETFTAKRKPSGCPYCGAEFEE